MKKKARRIAVLSQKGGAGKTTVSMQLAAGLSRRGARVGVVDLDPQQSALRWAQSAAVGQGFPAEVRSLSGKPAQLASAVDEFARECDFLVLDCPPSIEHPHVSTALDVAHVALMPVVPSPPDLWSARAMEQLILQTMFKRPKLSGTILINRAQRTALSASVVKLLREFELPVMRAGMSQRNAFAQSAATGGSVFDFGKSSALAQAEVDRIIDALLSLIRRQS